LLLALESMVDQAKVGFATMKLFKCQHCGQIIYFENQKCEKCGHRLGYMPEAAVLSALEPQGDSWRALAISNTIYRFCANTEFDVCNWLVRADTTDNYCVCCRHNRTIPDVGVQANLIAWRKIEAAKHRLFYTLLKLGLPLELTDGVVGENLVFDFLATCRQDDTKVMTGHDDGLITIALDEADDVEREKRRTSMHEPYRTLLGHFRHEVGHYYWDRLVRDGGKLEPIRQVFGDERADYEQALQRHYANGPPENWQEGFVSSYATSHPWEDFAETWAHYLHIVDTLEMAAAFGVNIHPALAKSGELDATVNFDPSGDFTLLIDTWIPLSNALNNLNRTMGQPDLYPFILSPPVIAKLRTIHDLVHARF
jgi:hypothetical protein